MDTRIHCALGFQYQHPKSNPNGKPN